MCKENGKCTAVSGVGLRFGRFGTSCVCKSSCGQHSTPSTHVTNIHSAPNVESAESVESVPQNMLQSPCHAQLFVFRGQRSGHPHGDQRKHPELAPRGKDSSREFALPDREHHFCIMQISMRYEGTHEHTAEVLTKGSCTSNQWKPFVWLIQIRPPQPNRVECSRIHSQLLLAPEYKCFLSPKQQ